MLLRLGCTTLGFLIFVLAGCSSAPKERFYTLRGSVDTEMTAAPLISSYHVAIDPISLPDSVDRPQMVVRVAENRVELLEQHRWVEPLKSEIPRVIAAHLSKDLGGALVSIFSDNVRQDAQYHVSVDVRRFEGVLGKAVTVEAIWRVSCTTSKDASKTGRFVLVDPIQGDGYDALVASYGRALKALSFPIAQAIQSLHLKANIP